MLILRLQIFLILVTLHCLSNIFSLYRAMLRYACPYIWQPLAIGMNSNKAKEIKIRKEAEYLVKN